VEPVHRAFIVGNANFPADPNNLPTLHGPALDVRLVADTLTHPDVGLFRKEHVKVLFDNDRQEVETALENFLMTAAPDDHLLLYYSGHGVLDRADRLYFCARDSRLDRLVTTAISENQVKGMLDNSPARSFIILLDCCNSGTFANKGGGLPDSLRGVGRHIITSTNRKQPAADGTTTTSASPFTACLCEGILEDDIDANADGFVSLHELYLYVREKLHRDTGQVPLYDAGKTGDIAIARSRKRAPAPATDDRPQLALSTASIDIPNVMAGEHLAAEVVEVVNTGSGTLDWEATCDAPWVTVRREAERLLLDLKPSIGMNRAVVSVRDRGRGGAQTVRVSGPVAPHARRSCSSRTTSWISARSASGARRRARRSSCATWATASSPPGSCTPTSGSTCSSTATP
jgi:Caspase domain